MTFQKWLGTIPSAIGGIVFSTMAAHLKVCWRYPSSWKRWNNQRAHVAQICQLYRHTPTRTHIYGLLTSTTLEISPNSSHLLSIDLIRSILHYTLYTIHHVLSTLCYILYSIHHTPCTIHYILYTIHIRSTASRWLCVFLIHGMLSMILDVLVPVELCVIFCVKAVNTLFTGSGMKSHFAYTKPPFLCFLHSPQLIGFHDFLAVLVFCSQQHFKFFQEPFRIWIPQAWSPLIHVPSNPPPLQNATAI